MSLSKLSLLCLLGITIGALGCRSENAPTPPEEPVGQEVSAQSHLTMEQLQNASYRVDESEGGVIQLADGLYEGPPYVEGGASRPIFRLSDKVALGDLDRDGNRDAVAVLVSSFGGSGTFHHLKAMLSVDDKPVEAAELLLGDRVQVKSLKVEDGVIQLDMLVHSADNAAPTPTLEVTKHYRLQNGRLVTQPK